MRRQAYHSVFCGSAGHHYGNNAVWGMSAIPDYQPGCEAPWKEHLGDPGASVFLIGRLMASRAWHTLVPDRGRTVMTAGSGAGASDAPCERTRDGSTVMAYIPEPRTVTIDMARVSGTTARCWWFDPRTGASRRIGDFPCTGRRDFHPPDDGDWVLVIDDAARPLPAPGSRR